MLYPRKFASKPPTISLGILHIKKNHDNANANWIRIKNNMIPSL